MKKSEKKEKQEEKILTNFYKGVHENRNRLIVLLCWFAVSLVLAFIQVSTSETVLSFSLEDYEVGQISDRAIIAERDLPADEVFPFEIMKGETVVKKGFAITETALEKLRKMAETTSYFDTSAYFDAVLYYLSLAMLIAFLYSPAVLGYRQKKREQIFVVISLGFVYASCVFLPLFFNLSNEFMLPVAIPAAMAAILITVMFGQMSAIYYSVITFFIVLQSASFNAMPAIFELASCLSAVFIVRKISRRFDMVVASLSLAGVNIIIQFLLTVIFNGRFIQLPLTLTGVALNGFLSCILALGFITPFELLLNTASVFRLMDLSDLNSPIMRKLLITAPGTYNHSMMVATLAESACAEIGANPLLARVGAYYHDLGKIDQPEYFVENQSGSNKHDDLNPRLSVSVIKSHVKKGVEKARQLHLPEEVIDIISEHHGNSLVSYFFNEAKKLDEQVSPEEYSYTGNPPATKEAAVVMLADTVEAACRTLEKPSVSRLEKFIHTLVTGKYEHGQLDKSSLTFRDLNTIEATFVTILAGHYHSRIEYPDQKDPDALPDKTEKIEEKLPAKAAEEGEKK